MASDSGRRRRVLDSDMASDSGRRRRRRLMDTDTDFQLGMEKASFFENLSEVFSELFSTAVFKLSSTGLELRANDTNCFAMFQLRSEAFDPYICNDDVFVRLNLADLAKAFSFANNDDIVTIKYQNGGKNITFSLDSPYGAVVSDLDFDLLHVNKFIDILEYLKFELSNYGLKNFEFFDFTDDRKHISEYPDSMYEAIVRMPSAKFMHFCNKLGSFGDSKTVVSISVDEDSVSFSTDGETIVCLQTQNDDKQNEATRTVMKEKISLTFGLRYLKNLSKASTMSDQLTIKLSSNLPVVFECKIPEMGYIRYYMMSAPPSAPPAPPPLCHCPSVKPPATIVELRKEKATFLKNVLEVLSVSGLFSKANFKFSSTGLELQAMDARCIALVVLQLRSKAFSSYSCSDGTLSVYPTLADMAKACSFANDNDIITIKIQEGAETVVIELKSPDGSEYFKLNSVSVHDLPVPILEYKEFHYQAIIRMPSAEFMRLCNQLSSFADWETAPFCISMDKDHVEFFTSGKHGYSEIVYQLSQTVDKSEATYIGVKMKENISLTFPLRYMSFLCKAYTLSGQLTIKLSSKISAAFEYNIADSDIAISYDVIPEEITEIQDIAEDFKQAELLASGAMPDPFSYFVVPP